MDLFIPVKRHFLFPWDTDLSRPPSPLQPAAEALSRTEPALISTRLTFQVYGQVCLFVCLFVFFFSLSFFLLPKMGDFIPFRQHQPPPQPQNLHLHSVCTHLHHGNQLPVGLECDKITIIPSFPCFLHLSHTYFGE